MATSTAAAAKAAAPAMAMATATASFCLRSNCHVNTCCQNNIQSSMTLKVKASQIQSSTTSRRQRRPQNVDGDIFVDHTCIDCDTCRWMAPEIFTRVDGMSAVFKQPSSEEERLKALQVKRKRRGSYEHVMLIPKGNGGKTHHSKSVVFLCYRKMMAEPAA